MSGYRTVATTAEIPAGEARVFEVDGRSIALCHVAGEGYYAIANVCTHDAGPLGEGQLQGDRIECPRHGALFDVKSGQAKTLPAVGRVPSYDVRVTGDTIQIAVEED